MISSIMVMAKRSFAPNAIGANMITKMRRDSMRMLKAALFVIFVVSIIVVFVIV